MYLTMMSMSVVSDMSLLLLMPLVSESAGDVLRVPIIRLSEVVPDGVCVEDDDDADADTGRESPIVPTPLVVGMLISLGMLRKEN